MDRIKKALDDHGKMCESGRLQGLTPFDVNLIWYILKDLAKGIESGTTSEKVASWFRKRMFSVTPCDIGWAIKI